MPENNSNKNAVIQSVLSLLSSYWYSEMHPEDPHGDADIEMKEENLMTAILACAKEAQES